MLRPCDASDQQAMYDIINAAAQAYRGVIPADRWHEPYMPLAELEAEIAARVVFWGYEESGRLRGVMGIQDRGEVMLIRHAYVRPEAQRRGIGTRLLRHLDGLARKPMLIGTWAAAVWAITFYQRNGYRLVPADEKRRLLERYWSIPARQVETSIVLADQRWWTIAGRSRAPQ